MLERGYGRAFLTIHWEAAMPGVLRVKGTIDLAQFWPDGEADADTTKIKVQVGANSFSFAADGKTFKPTKVYFGAVVRGTSSDPVIDKQGRITVRLQGVDAPELHYRAAALKQRPDVSQAKRKKFNELNKTARRQYWAETATVALCKKLKTFGNGVVKCEMRSLIDHPAEVIDTYGRFVGNIYVGPKFGVDINVWLAAEGWVYPTYYSSMTVEEIDVLDAAAEKGKTKKRTWKDYLAAVNKFDKKLVYRKHGPIDAANDKGPVLMPKIYRRQVSYQMQKAAGIAVGKFAEFLAKSPDRCFLTKEFIEQSIHTAEPRVLHDFIKGNKFTLKPQELVFKEKFSDLRRENGAKITKF
jgi:endonuclease YncB( thermonuclease family)